MKVIRLKENFGVSLASSVDAGQLDYLAHKRHLLMQPGKSLSVFRVFHLVDEIPCLH